MKVWHVLLIWGAFIAIGYRFPRSFRYAPIGLLWLLWPLIW